MAATVLTNEYIALNAVSYSDRAMQAVLSWEAAEVDTTVFDPSGTKTVVGGIKSGSLKLKFRDDFVDDDLDEDLWVLFNTVTTFEVRAVNTTVSANNPKYTGSVLINKYALGGEVGALATKELEFPISGNVTRATA